jgi:hypothetical protein
MTIKLNVLQTFLNEEIGSAIVIFSVVERGRNQPTTKTYTHLFLALY